MADSASSVRLLPKRDPFSGVQLGPLLGRGSYGQAGLHTIRATVLQAPAICPAAALALQAMAAAHCDEHPMAWHSRRAIMMAACMDGRSDLVDTASMSV